MARTCPASGPRTQEPTLPIAIDRRESHTRPRTSSGGIRRGLSREHRNPRHGDRESQNHHRPLQRLQQDAEATAGAHRRQGCGRARARTSTRQQAPAAGEEPTAARQPIHFKVELAPRALPIDADPELLHRALSNLVLNAMDAMPDGGTLTLSAKAARRPGGDPHSRHRCAE